MLATRPVAFAIFPTDDRLFAAFVQRSFERVRAEGHPTPNGLQGALRTYHTRAVVRPRTSLAGFGERDLWYAYRDGRPDGRGADAWWTDPGVARVTFDDRGRFITADDEACRLVGVPPGTLDGRSAFDVVVDGGREVMEDLVWAEYRRTGVLHSVFDCRLPDGSIRVIEYHSRRTATPGRSEGAWREFALVESLPPADEARRPDAPAEGPGRRG